MARDILNEYGPNSPANQKPSATSGGVTQAKPLPYSPPVGPKSVNDPKTPGIHGTVYPCGTQHK